MAKFVKIKNPIKTRLKIQNYRGKLKEVWRLNLHSPTSIVQISIVNKWAWWESNPHDLAGHPPKFAAGRSRTDMRFPPRVFETRVSTNFTTAANFGGRVSQFRHMPS